MKIGKHRLLGLDTGSNGRGSLHTKAFILGEDQITVDAEIKGSMCAELCDPFGKPLAGFEKLKSIPVTGDSARHILRWENQPLEPLVYDPISLRLEIDNGILYSITL